MKNLTMKLTCATFLFGGCCTSSYYSILKCAETVGCYQGKLKFEKPEACTETIKKLPKIYSITYSCIEFHERKED